MVNVEVTQIKKAVFIFDKMKFEGGLIAKDDLLKKKPTCTKNNVRLLLTTTNHLKLDTTKIQKCSQFISIMAFGMSMESHNINFWVVRGCKARTLRLHAVSPRYVWPQIHLPL